MFNFFNSRKNKEERFVSEQVEGAPLVTYFNPKSIVAEEFRTIRTNIDFAQVDRNIKSLVISSSIPAEGKSTVSANLAIAMGAMDKKVLIIDADMRKPTLHRTFTLSNERGLTTLLANPDIHFNEVVMKSNELKLYLLPSGPIPPNPAELLASSRMTKLMNELYDYFDLIIYDAPPITSVTDPQILATKVDGVILVVRQGYVKKDEVRRAKQTLDNVDANILGYVLNGKERENSGGYYAYYGYGYGYSDKEREENSK